MKKLYRRSISGLMALLICFTTILGGGITAFAASSSGEVAKSYSIGFPRSGDANLDYSGTWGHDELHYMNGWTSGEATWMTTLHTIGSFDGPACYCIEPGVPRLLEKTYTRYGEDYWKNYPSDYNSTIDADTIKTLLGRIMQYGYQGDLSLDWRSQNETDADKMAHMMATQVLVWETVVGERDANFNHVDPGSADAVKSVYRTSHPLYSRFSAYYDSIEASVQSHTVIPSFMSKTPNKAQTVELKWDGMGRPLSGRDRYPLQHRALSQSLCHTTAPTPVFRRAAVSVRYVQTSTSANWTTICRNRPGLEAGDIFRGISQELAHAHLDDGAYKRSDHAFTAYCVSYVLCSRYNVPKDMFRFDRLPEGFSTMDARSVRNELSKIRDVANEISSDMAKVLDKSMKPKERRDEAR